MQMKDIIPGLAQKHKSIRALSQVPSKPTAGLLPENQVHPAKVKKWQTAWRSLHEEEKLIYVSAARQERSPGFRQRFNSYPKTTLFHNFLTHSSPVSKFGMYITHNPFDESGVLHM